MRIHTRDKLPRNSHELSIVSAPRRATIDRISDTGEAWRCAARQSALGWFEMVPSMLSCDAPWIAAERYCQWLAGCAGHFMSAQARTQEIWFEKTEN